MQPSATSSWHPLRLPPCVKPLPGCRGKYPLVVLNRPPEKDVLRHAAVRYGVGRSDRVHRDALSVTVAEDDVGDAVMPAEHQEAAEVAVLIAEIGRVPGLV